MGNYPLRYLKKAFGGWLGRANTLSGIITVVLATLSHYNPWWSEAVNMLLWQVPLAVFGVMFIVGLVLAPYLIHKEDEREIKRLQLQLGEGAKPNFSIVWYSEEWRLREPNGWRNYWDNEDIGIGLQLIGGIAINIKDKIRIESVVLDMGGRTLESDWESQEFYISEEREVKFDIPFDIQRGKRTAILKAIVGGQQYSPEPITLNVPKGKQVFHK